MTEQPNTHLQPFRFQLEWVAAVKDLDEAERQFDQTIDWIEEFSGHVQFGCVGPMPAEDIVPGSPLAKVLGV